MRDIKFRVFFDNEMLPWNGHVKGNPFYLAPTAGNPCVVFYHDKTNEPHFIGEGRLKSVMQYTGLKDKNGKEIYEGDIVKYWTSRFPDSKYKAKIIFNENIAAFQISYQNMNDHWVSDNIFPLEFEVIGNIHENPELIK